MHEENTGIGRWFVTILVVPMLQWLFSSDEGQTWLSDGLWWCLAIGGLVVFVIVNYRFVRNNMLRMWSDHSKTGKDDAIGSIRKAVSGGYTRTEMRDLVKLTFSRLQPYFVVFVTGLSLIVMYLIVSGSIQMSEPFFSENQRMLLSIVGALALAGCLIYVAADMVLSPLTKYKQLAETHSRQIELQHEKLRTIFTTYRDQLNQIRDNVRDNQREKARDPEKLKRILTEIEAIRSSSLWLDGMERPKPASAYRPPQHIDENSDDAKVFSESKQYLTWIDEVVLKQLM